MLKKIITVLMILGILFRICWLLYDNREKYVPDYWVRYPTLKTVFDGSQYMMKNYKYLIPDETGYAYAGGAYLRGANPILVESTQPPLGKYLISLSIALTGSEHVIVAVFFVLLMSGMYILSKQITGSTVISLTTVLVALFERLFTDQLSISPLLDLFNITFLLFSVIATSRALEKKKPALLLLSYACLGAALMIKVWVAAAVFVALETVYLLLRYRTSWRYIIGGFVIMLGITLGSYIQMFLSGYNILQVLLVQKYLYWYHSSKQTGFFTIWPLVFFNRWYVWWGTTPVIHDQNWSVTWPIVIGSSMLASLRILMRPYHRTGISIQLTALSILGYCAFMSLEQASARYLLPVLPFCYVMVGWILYRLGRIVPFTKKII